MPSIATESCVEPRGTSDILFDRVITGAARIAARAGCSERTIRREYKSGRLPAFKTGGRTSPIKIRVSHLNDYLRDHGG